MTTQPKSDPKAYTRDVPGMPPGTPGASKYNVSATPATPTPPESTGQKQAVLVDLGEDEHGPLKPGGRAPYGGTGHA